MLKITTYANGKIQPDSDEAKVNEHLKNRDAMVWVDAHKPNDSDWETILELFTFHPLAVEDAKMRNQRAKVDFYDGYLFLSIQAWRDEATDQLTTADPNDVTSEIDVFLGANYIVTIHDGDCSVLKETLRRWQARPDQSPDPSATSAQLLYMLLDAVVDDYFPAMDALDQSIDDIETAIYDENVGQSGLDTKPALRLRKRLLLLRQIVTPMRDLLNTLLRVEDEHLIPRGMHIYFQDVYDHALRLVEQVDLHRDILTGALESILAQTSNRLNMVMKTMTAISTILMSDALIASIYGMNFENIPELKNPHGYYYCLGGMAVISLGLAALFKRSRWL